MGPVRNALARRRAGRKIAKFARKRLNARKVARVSKPLARAIRKVVNSQAETKYVAREVNDGYIVGNLIGDQPYRRLQTVLPQITQGTSAQSRIGNVIKPIKLSVTVQYFFQGNGLEGSQDTNSVINSGLFEVRQFSVQPRLYRSAATWTPAVAAVEQTKLLEKGDGTTVVPYSASATNVLYPVSNENFITLAGNKRIMLGKNAGLIQQSADKYPLTNIRAQDTIHYNVKCPAVLKYDENSNYPTNFNPLWGAYATLLTNYGPATASTTYDGLLNPLLGTGAPTHPIIRYNLRVEMWYKDE